MPEHAIEIFAENVTKMVKVIPLNAKNEDQTLSSTKTLHFPIQCNGNYRGPSRNDYNALGVWWIPFSIVAMHMTLCHKIEW